MRCRLGSRNFTKFIASETNNPELIKAIENDDVYILCDSRQKKFWFSYCSDEMWDIAVKETKKISGFELFGDDKSEDIDIAISGVKKTSSTSTQPKASK